MKKVVIVVPTYNEAKNIEPLIKGIEEAAKKAPSWEISILFVDSFSPDGTDKVVKKVQKTHPQIHLISTEKSGLGRAYTEGFSYAIAHMNPQVIFEMDADLSHDTTVVPKFLKAIEEGADFVIGSRYIKGGSIPADWGLHRKLFSVMANIFVKFGFMKPYISDWTSGYRAIKVWVIRDALSHIKKYSGYVFQIAFLDFALKHGAKIKEVPIKFVDRKHGISKINASHYIFTTIAYTLLFSSFIRYALVGVGGFAIDFGISYLLIEKAHFALWVATVISAEAAVIFNFTLNNFWSFSHKKLDNKLTTYLWKLLSFNVIASGALAIQAGGIELLAHLFGAHWWAVYKVCILAFIVIPYSYIFYNRIIWKDKK